jgi:hypothetical protein
MRGKKPGLGLRHGGKGGITEFDDYNLSSRYPSPIDFRIGVIVSKMAAVESV